MNFPIAPPPPPQTGTPLRGQWGNPGNCHEQLLFFTHKGIYTLSDLALALLDLEKKIFEN